MKNMSLLFLLASLTFTSVCFAGSIKSFECKVLQEPDNAADACSFNDGRTCAQSVTVNGDDATVSFNISVVAKSPLDESYFGPITGTLKSVSDNTSQSLSARNTVNSSVATSDAIQLTNTGVGGKWSGSLFTRSKSVNLDCIAVSIAFE